MNKKGQMRWTPIGALRVLQVRAAVAEGRLMAAAFEKPTPHQKTRTFTCEIVTSGRVEYRLALEPSVKDGHWLLQAVQSCGAPSICRLPLLSFDFFKQVQITYLPPKCALIQTLAHDCLIDVL